MCTPIQRRNYGMGLDPVYVANEKESNTVLGLAVADIHHTAKYTRTRMSMITTTTTTTTLISCEVVYQHFGVQLANIGRSHDFARAIFFMFAACVLCCVMIFSRML